MNGLRQAWLVARREMRERSRSKGFRFGLALMVLVVAAMIAVPGLFDSGHVTRDVGAAGIVPDTLSLALETQGDAVDMTVRVHHYDTVAAGEQAVRDGKVDVLVVDARRLAWHKERDEQLRAVVTGAIQLVAIEQRAEVAGIDPAELRDLLAPVPVENEQLGVVAGRGPDDELAAMVMATLLLIAISTYGNLVLTGVVEEKSSRVVEVLLAHMPARNVLAGKVAGIGLLGFAQFLLTALVALVTTMVVDSVDLPAVHGTVLAWVVVWFVLGYTLYAVVYGALGSLASRTEDAQSVAGPVVFVLIGAFWGSFLAIGGDPDGTAAVLLSLFPVTAPFAMPGRIALGVAPWWQAVAGVALTLAAVAGLVVLAGRVYTSAILHSGPAMSLRAAWRRAEPGTPTPSP